MMGRMICLFGQADALEVLPSSSGGAEPLLSPEVKLILGVATAVAALLVFWAYFIRKRQPTDPHLRPIEGGGNSRNSSSEDGRTHRRRGRRHRHRRRRTRSRDLPRNPSLQETGGLPPLRPENEPPRI